MQDEKGNKIVGFLLVFTTRINNHVIKFVENVGVAPEEDDQLQAMIDRRKMKLTGFVDEMKKAQKPFRLGYWTGPMVLEVPSFRLFLSEVENEVIRIAEMEI